MVNPNSPTAEAREAGWTYEYYSGAGWETHVVLNTPPSLPTKTAQTKHYRSSDIRNVQPFYYALSRPTAAPDGAEGEPCRFVDCPPGHFIYADMLCFKSEYSSKRGQPDAYCCATGEYFWGGTHDLEERRNLMVQPIEALSRPTAAPDGAEFCPTCGTHEVSLERTCHNSSCSSYALAETVYEGWKAPQQPAPSVEVERLREALLKVAANLRGRANREVAVASEEHGFDLEAMEQYADHILAALAPADAEGRE